MKIFAYLSSSSFLAFPFTFGFKVDLELIFLCFFPQLTPYRYQKVYPFCTIL